MIDLHEVHFCQYELEREKLATELEEERRSHKERDQCIREQQMKIDNLSNLITSSDSERSSSSYQVNPLMQLLDLFTSLFILTITLF